MRLQSRIHIATGFCLRKKLPPLDVMPPDRDNSRDD